jgi:hypothetical protein
MSAKALLSASVSAPPAVYVEDVFSTYLYTGNDSPQTITNGIDLAGEGGLVWLKNRSVTSAHRLVDTVRGALSTLFSDSTSAAASRTAPAADVDSFTSTGFVAGYFGSTGGHNWASWTFRKAEKFFDVVTYTGNGTSGRTVAHNLGSVPGCIIVKCLNDNTDWPVYHRSLNGGVNPHQYRLRLNSTAAQSGPGTEWSAGAPTATEFTLTNAGDINASGRPYVAYLFAHDAGGFGTAGTDSVISCGSFTTNSSGVAVVDLGYEPQWALVKPISGASNMDWRVMDNMRGITVDNAAVLSPNSSAAEFTSGTFKYSINGFTSDGLVNSTECIYIAIRRGPMKTPTDATEVFSTLASSGAQGTALTTGFPVDMQIARLTSFVDSLMAMVLDRMRGVSSTDTARQGPTLATSSTDAENTSSYTNRDWNNVGFDVPTYIGGLSSVYWNFRRAPGFMDVCCYTGTGSAQTITHNLGAVPELMITKERLSGSSWAVYSAAVGATTAMYLNGNFAAFSPTSAFWNNTAPTASVFTVGSSAATGSSGNSYVAYLFATCPGVSKVGSYTGTGTTLSIDCGFTTGARFILIKRTDSTGDWYVWDTARGIVSGDDPYLLLNSTAAEVTNTDYIDPLSSGFQISSTAPAAINASGGSFIFLAIA